MFQHTDLPADSGSDSGSCNGMPAAIVFSSGIGKGQAGELYRNSSLDYVTTKFWRFSTIVSSKHYLNKHSLIYYISVANIVTFLGLSTAAYISTDILFKHRNEFEFH